MGSFLFDRVISVYRQEPERSEGPVGYQGRTQEREELLFEAIPCNIESRSSGRANPTGLPSDHLTPSWVVNIPRGKVPAGGIKSGHMMTDDLGRRFRVTAPEWHGLGWKITVDGAEL